MKRISPFLVSLTAIVLLVGCGKDPSPVASGGPTLTHSEDGRAFITFSSEATRGAARIASGEGRSVTKVFGENADDILIKETGDPSTRLDDFKVEFDVFDNALTEDVEITMTVYGNTLSTVVIAFEPGGLEFLVDAQLEIDLGDHLIDMPLDDLNAWHMDSDGNVDEARIKDIDDDATGVEIEIWIPGFSRYGLGE